MVEYLRKMGSGENVATIKGAKCDKCSYAELENDEDVWSAVGL